MKIASHFIGLKIRSEHLAALYARLQKAIGKDSDVIEFQNILSSHVTLFYFPDGVRSEDMTKAQRAIRRFDMEKLEQGFEGYGYFWTSDSPRLCYLAPKNAEMFKEWNEELKSEFQEYLDDSELPFTPHVTLFRIRRVAKFLEMKDEIDAIVREEISVLRSAPVFERVSIFQVHSGFRPQIHIELP